MLLIKSFALFYHLVKIKSLCKVFGFVTRSNIKARSITPNELVD